MTFPGWNGWTDQVQVTEREIAHYWPDGRWDDAAWEDCLWCSAIMFFRAQRLTVPPTHDEAEALRCDSGEPPMGGSNFGDLRIGAANRYGITSGLDSIAGATAVWSALVPGTVAIVNGSMGVWPQDGYWRRWDPQFGGAHSVCVFRLDDQDRVWWANPLAPEGYDGEWMSGDDLRLYIGGYSAIVAPITSQGSGGGNNDVTITNAKPLSGTVTLLHDCSAFVVNKNDTAPFAGGDTYQVVFFGNVGPWSDVYVATIYGELNAFQPADVKFTPATTPATITLGPGLYQVK